VPRGLARPAWCSGRSDALGQAQRERDDRPGPARLLVLVLVVTLALTQLTPLSLSPPLPGPPHVSDRRSEREFYTALKLVALVQSGQPPSLSGLTAKTALPKVGSLAAKSTT